jgi:hypothetical protein
MPTLDAAAIARRMLLVATFLSLSPAAAAQEITRGPITLPANWVQGFARAVEGERLIYPWAYPGQARALLTRTTDGRMTIEWEAQAPPDGPADEPVSFMWHAGLASGYGAHRFTLSVNGAPVVTFTSGRDANDREWTVTGQSGVTLSFKTTRVGTFNELFGFMVLSLPNRLVASGAPRFAVVGEAAGNRDYYMTFQEPVAAWVRARAEEAVLAGGHRAIRLEASHLADPADGRATADGIEIWSGQVTPGYTSVLAPGPEATAGRVALAVDVAGHDRLETTLRLPPVRHWEIHLLPHSHVDIGYSDPQPEVERKQWRNLREAVALARKTASYPPEARFKWNVEGLWSVESYLKQAPPIERDEFVAAVKSGAIGLQANYTNILTGLCSPEELARWTDEARRLQAQYGLSSIRSAMHSDIPGLSWPVVTALAQSGVRYVSSGPNYMPGLPDLGDRIGHTLRALGDRPFWWVSPSGEDRILFWMAGRGYSWFHGLNMGPAAKAGQGPLLDYVRQLAESGYAWDLVQVRYTIGGDNGPVDPDLPDVVRAWNDRFEWPRLVISTAEATFAELERRHGASLPSRSGDMTPYWEDGAVSTAAFEAMVRESARRLVQAETLWSLRSPADVPAGELAVAWRNVLLWHEHTWGAADSIADPDRADVVGQWTYKVRFATEADRQSADLLRRALGEASPASDDRRTAAERAPAARPPAVRATGRDKPARSPGVLVDILNTASWSRTGLVWLASDLSLGRDRARDPLGRALPTQRLRDGRLAVRVSGVPPLGSASLTLTFGRAAPPATPARVEGTSVLDNGRVRVEIHGRTGAIRSLRWAGAPGQELVQQGAASGDARTAAGLNAWLYVPGRDPSQTQGVSSVRITVEEPGPLVATLRIESDAPGTNGLVRRITLTAGDETIAIEDVIDKTKVRTKESAHIAFPFDVRDGAIRVDQGSALVAPERDQLPGSCRDFIGVHSAVDVSNATLGISLATLDAPLVELGAITDERQADGTPRRWRERTAPGTTLYAYLLNNYWHTNYKADQDGRLTFRFALRPHGAFDAASLRRFGAALEQPLLARPARAALDAPFVVAGPGVVVSSVRVIGEGGRAFLVRLYNASERATTVRIGATGTNTRLLVTRADADGRSLDPPASSRTLAPLATMLVRVETR